MDYDLAKELKDAGFPQEPDIDISGLDGEFKGGFYLFINNEVGEGAVTFLDERGYDAHKSAGNETLIKMPTTAELIDACGKNMWTMRRGIYKGEPGWVVGQDTNGSVNPVDWEMFEFGKTLDVAVARFWLIPNK